MIPILIKSNYPKSGIVTIEYNGEIKEFKASDWNELTKNAKSNFDLRKIIEELV